MSQNRVIVQKLHFLKAVVRLAFLTFDPRKKINVIGFDPVLFQLPSIASYWNVEKLGIFKFLAVNGAINRYESIDFLFLVPRKK